jgi:hypothetical protein
LDGDVAEKREGAEPGGEIVLEEFEGRFGHGAWGE